MGKLKLRHRINLSHQRIEGFVKDKYKFCFRSQNTNINAIHVLANGPSLWESASCLGQDDFIITVNDAYKDERILALKPNYHLLIDPFYADKLDYRDELMNLLIEEKIQKIVLTPYIYKAWFPEFVDRICIVNTRCINYAYVDQIDRIAYEKNYICPVPQAVPIVALYLATQLNPKMIFLHGNDFDYLKNFYVGMNNHLYSKDSHFYAEEMVDVTDVWGRCLQEQLEAIVIALRGYKQIGDYAKHKGITIYNTSKNSMIDVFERTEDWKELI